MQLIESYKLRSIRYIDLFDENGWRMKVYGISYEEEFPKPHAIEIGKKIARELLPQAAVSETHYGVGFIVIHEARDANFFLIDWWSHENAINHHIFTSPFEFPEKVEKITEGPNICVWELRVIGYERQAWLDNVLANPMGPDVERYLSFRLNENC